VTSPAVPVAVRLRRLVWSLMTMVWVLALVGPMIMIGQHVVSERISYRYAPAIDNAHRVTALMASAQSDLRLYHERPEASIVAGWPAQREESRRLLEDLGRLAPSDEAAQLVDRAHAASTAWWDEAERVRGLVDEGGPSDIMSPAVHHAEFRNATTDLVSQLSDGRARLRNLRQAIIAAGVLLAVAAIVAATVYGRRRERRATVSIVAPIQALDSVVARQRSGDEDARADTDRGPTEVRNLAAELNSMLDQNREFKREQVHLTTMQSVALRAGQVLRETSYLAEAAQTIARDLTRGVGCDLCVLRFRSVSGEEVTYSHARPDGPYAHLDEAGVAALLPATPPEPSANRTVVNPYAVSPGGPGSMVIAPIRLGRDRLGSIVVADAEGPHRWPHADIAALEQIAGKFARTLFERIAHEQQLEALRQLQELDRQKDAFVSTVSHELRTPLTSIAGYAEMLSDGSAGDLSPEQLRLVEVIDRNTRRLQAMIEDILLLSTIEAHDGGATHREVDLAEVATTLAEDLLPWARAKGVDVLVDAPAPALVQGDAAHLQRALTNLVSNALKFTPAGGTVTITVAATAAQVTAAVADTGIGIPAAQVPELFNRFFRASNAETASIPGTGLGLSIVRQIAVEHRGSVKVTSREGEGSTFLLTLPSAEAP
jgi:two-component system phosphate regulon sensor histidine kinase PhoR